MVSSRRLGLSVQPSSRISRSAPLSLERQIVEVAGEQLGLITVDQAKRVGVDADALRRRELSGLLIRMFVGVYRIVGVAPSVRQECLASCLAIRDSAVCGLSAALVHGFPLGELQPSRPSIVVPANREIAARGIATHRTRHLPPTQPWFTGRITTIPATIVDLAGLVSANTLSRCIDHTLADRTATVDRVLKVVNQRPPARFAGRAVLIAALDARSGGKLLHRSRYEQKVLPWLLAAGVPRPGSNLMVDGVEVDFGWPEFRIALEISPFFTHGSEHTQRRDAQRRRILQKAGWWVIEATDEQLLCASSFAPIIVDLLALMRRVG